MKGDFDLIRISVVPLSFSNREIRLSTALVKIWRDVNLDPQFLGEDLRTIRVICLRIAARYQDSSVIKQLVERAMSYEFVYVRKVTHRGFRMIQASNNSVVENGETFANWLGRVI